MTPLTPQEQQVIDKLKQGFDPTWAAFLEELIPRYYRLFKKLTEDDETAQDFTNEAIIILVRTIGKLP